MEWGTITTLVAEVLFGGGLLAFVTIKDKSELHEKLDKANSRAAVNKLLKCQEIGCSKRRPPLGEGAADTFKQIRNGNLGEEEA